MNRALEQAMRAQSTTQMRSASAAELAPRRLQVIPLSDPRANARAWSRALNVVIAVIGLIVALPLMLIIAVLVKLTSPGPVIYSQTRVGLDRRRGPTWGGNHRRQVDYGGRLFRIYKFRTMHASPHSELQVWADPSDKRVTRIGRILRSYRLDELPQLFNVIKGDMNVVGPRPEQPKIFLDLHRQIQNYGQRQRVLPGITGWAQINHHYDRSIDDVKRKLAFDLEYIERQAPLTDLQILARTIPVILLRRGAW
jgi:lipopolysaccharide/colanic/teichoic acid biosynthesis glycosyltransferase